MTDNKPGNEPLDKKDLGVEPVNNPVGPSKNPPKDEYGERGVKREDDTSIIISNQEIKALPPAQQVGGASVGNSPILQEMNGLPESEVQVGEQVFEEIPEEYCAQLYNTGLECVWSLKNKGFPIRELPEKRVKEQGHIIYEIMKKNQISFGHIDIFMLGCGMFADWKFMDSYAAEQKQEEKMAGAEK